MIDIDVKAGYFGKFPELGDFVKKDLPRSFLDPWDLWLQRALYASREHLGDQWLEVYLTSPVWRFALSKGLCGNASWIGLLMPSVDRVGRYFPLTLALELPSTVDPFRAMYHAADWLDEGSRILLSVLEAKEFDISQFDQEVTKLHVPESLFREPMAINSNLASEICCLGAEAGDFCDAGLHFSHCWAARQLGNYSLWWDPGSEGIQCSMLLAAGLPSPEHFSGMLTGTWIPVVGRAAAGKRSDVYDARKA